MQNICPLVIPGGDGVPELVVTEIPTGPGAASTALCDVIRERGIRIVFASTSLASPRKEACYETWRNAYYFHVLRPSYVVQHRFLRTVRALRGCVDPVIIHVGEGATQIGALVAGARLIGCDKSVAEVVAALPESLKLGEGDLELLDHVLSYGRSDGLHTVWGVAKECRGRLAQFVCAKESSDSVSNAHFLAAFGHLKALRPRDTTWHQLEVWRCERYIAAVICGKLVPWRGSCMFAATMEDGFAPATFEFKGAPKIIAMGGPSVDSIDVFARRVAALGCTSVFNLAQPGECGNYLSSPEWPERVGHYHFRNWIDGDVPKLKGVVALAKRVLGSEGPILIHCIAGRGRTGTLIALTMMMAANSRGEALSALEAAGAVSAKRVYGVDTWQQLALLVRWERREALLAINKVYRVECS